MRLISQLKKTQGAMALVSTIVILAVGLIIGLTTVLNSLSQIDMNLDEAKSLKTFSLAEACVDEALIRLKWEETYLGGSLSLLGGSCIITVSEIVDGKQIDIQATIEDWTKKIRLQTTTDLVITNWQEI